MQAQRTPHTCGGPSFGRLTPGCPRCDELAAGASPRTWGGQTYTRCTGCGGRVERGYFAPRCERCQLADHFASDRHRNGGCGPVCTAGEW